MTTHISCLLASLAAAAPDTQPAQYWPWLDALLPAIAVAVVSALFQWSMSRHITRLEAKLVSKTGFFMRKLEAHEKLWPLVAACNRAQSSLAFQQKQGGHDLSPAAKEIAECRRRMKNFVYDNGLYFDQAVRMLVQELDDQLGDPKVSDVRAKTQDVEAKLKEIIIEIM